MSDFEIRQDDTQPPIAATLDTGTPIGNGTVKFIMWPHGEHAPTRKVDATATVVSTTTNSVRYDWQDGDTDAPGHFDALWEITYEDDTVQCVPATSSLLIYIAPKP